MEEFKENEDGFKEMDVYKLAFQLASEIFKETNNWPKAEIYSLTNQIRRSSRSVCANFGEGYRQRIQTKLFVHKLRICDGECSETLIWLDFAKECRYINEELYASLKRKCLRVGSMLGKMIQNPEKFNRVVRKNI
ncbi:MAG: four helix bundle protein [Bacteroidetes bacterium]|nr:four helix bundle protein [Bacteroidota bacterium]